MTPTFTKLRRRATLFLLALVALLAMALLASASVLGVLAYRSWRLRQAEVELLHDHGFSKHSITPVANVAPLPAWRVATEKFLAEFLGDPQQFDHGTDPSVSVPDIRDSEPTRNVEESMQHVGKLTYLESLDLTNVAITDEALRHLRNLTELRHLDLGNEPYRGINFARYGNRLTDAGFAALAGLEKITHLTLNGLPIGDQGLEHLARLRNMEDLKLRQTRVTGSGLRWLAGCRQLQRLDLNACPVTDEGLASCAALPQLESLNLECSRLTGSGLQGLAGCPRLKYLRLAGSPITGAGLARMPCLPDLETLDLQDTQVTDEGLASLARLPKLARLRLQGTRVTDGGMAALASAKSLVEIDLLDTQVSDVGVAQLAALPNLKALHLGEKVTGSGLASFNDAPPMLEALQICGKVTDETLTILTSQKKLVGLYLNCEQVTYRGAEQLAQLPALNVCALLQGKITATERASLESKISRVWINDDPPILFMGGPRMPNCAFGWPATHAGREQ